MYVGEPKAKWLERAGARVYEVYRTHNFGLGTDALPDLVLSTGRSKGWAKGHDDPVVINFLRPKRAAKEYGVPHHSLNWPGWALFAYVWVKSHHGRG